MYNEDDDSANDSDLKDLLVFPPKVQEAINLVIPSTDNLDSLEFDVVDYINKLFPTEQSLSNIDDVIHQVKKKIRTLDGEIGSVIRGQHNVAEEGRLSLEASQHTILQLFAQIRDIKEKAERSENMVKEITRDIKQLDNAKRNLTVSITTLNHLHMLVAGVDSLEQLTIKHEYNEVANLLEGVTNVLEQFNNYHNIPQIGELSQRVGTIKTDLAVQIRADFEEGFKGANSKYGQLNQSLLAEACFVVNVLDPKVKKDILASFIKHQLAEYAVLFADDQEEAWLDKIDHRYAWIKRSLLEFEEKFSRMFPPSWEVSERICVQFCHDTRNQLAGLMAKRVSSIDVKLLLFAIQRTMNFESLCVKRFPGRTIVSSYNTASAASPPPPAQSTSLNPFEEAENPPSGPFSNPPPSQPLPPQSSNAQPEATFIGLISKCFERHLNIYMESQDRNLADMIDRFSEDYTRQKNSPRSPDSNIIPSCADLFVYYKKCMVQCFQLSTGAPMLLLTRTFQKYLREYAFRILTCNMPKAMKQESLGGSIARFSKQETTIASASNFIQSILKEGTDISKLSEDEQAKICSILCTAEYCMETTQQLEEKLKEKVDAALASKVDLHAEQDIFHGVIASCIGLLVHDLESACDPALLAMSKIPWQNMDSVGDQSGYVSSIVSHLKGNTVIIGQNLIASRKYFTQFCIKFATSFIQKFVNALLKCKPISTVGAEQLLLDTHSLKMILQELPSIGLKDDRLAPISYTRIVIKGMTRAEMILKVIMSPHDPLPAFIDNYIKLLPESDITELQKILEMKGMRKIDQSTVMDIYRLKASKTTNLTLDSSAHPSLSGHAAPENESSRIRRLEKLIKKKL